MRMLGWPLQQWSGRQEAGDQGTKPAFHSVFHSLPERARERRLLALRVKSQGSVQIARGPRSRRAGKKNKALSRANTPPTAIPKMRNGSVSSQTMGYRNSARSASGQHNTN